MADDRQVVQFAAAVSTRSGGQRSTDTIAGQLLAAPNVTQKTCFPSNYGQPKTRVTFAADIRVRE